jgi:hypothetical protein
MTAAPSQATDETIRAAHQRMLADPSLQHDLPLPKAPPPPEQPPDWEWAGWVADLFNLLGPLLQLVFWGGLGVVVALLLFFMGREILRSRFPAMRPKPKKPKDEPATWRPDEQAARTLLADADSLAAEGRFAEAAHLLLLRSIEDIDSRRPRAVRPALTSRDIASLDALPETARPAFGSIARVVERSLFGGAPVDAGDFAACRQAYEAFALPTGWAQ